MRGAGRRSARWPLAASLAALGALTGCSLLADADAYGEGGCPGAGADRLVDLDLRLRVPPNPLADDGGPGPAWGFVLTRELPASDGSAGVQEQVLRGRGEGLLPEEDGLLRVPLRGAVPGGELGLSLWLDEDSDGTHSQEGDEVEPAWWVPVCSGRAAVDLGSEDLLPGNVFEGIRAPGGTFRFSVTSLGPHLPGSQHLRGVVAEAGGGPVVAWFEHPDVGEEVAFEIPGVLRPNQDYVVEFYADFTEDRAFQQPGRDGDHAWRLEGRSDAEGNLEMSFVHGTPFQRLDYF